MPSFEEGTAKPAKKTTKGIKRLFKAFFKTKSSKQSIAGDVEAPSIEALPKVDVEGQPKVDVKAEKEQKIKEKEIREERKTKQLEVKKAAKQERKEKKKILEKVKKSKDQEAITQAKTELKQASLSEDVIQYVELILRIADKEGKERASGEKRSAAAAGFKAVGQVMLHPMTAGGAGIFAKKVMSDLKKELGEEQKDINRVLESKTIRDLLQVPGLWHELEAEQVRVAEIISLFHREIDERVKAAIKPPSIINLKSVLILLSNITAEESARDALSSLMSAPEMQHSLRQYIAASPVLIVQLQMWVLGPEQTKEVIQKYLQHVNALQDKDKSKILETLNITLEAEESLSALKQERLDILLKYPDVVQAALEYCVNDKAITETASTVAQLQTEIADMVTPLLGLASSIIAHQKLYEILTLAAPSMDKIIDPKPALPLSQIIEVGAYICSDPDILTALQDIMRSPKFFDLADTLVTGPFKEKVEAALPGMSDEQLRSLTQQGLRVAGSVLDRMSPNAIQRLGAIAQTIIPEAGEALSTAQIMEAGVKILSDPAIMAVVKKTVKDPELGVLASTLITGTLKSKINTVFPGVSDEQLTSLTKNIQKVASTVVDGLTPAVLAKIGGIADDIGKLIAEPQPDDTKSQTEIDKEKMDSLWKVADCAIEILSDKEFGPSLHNSVKILIENNRSILKAALQQAMEPSKISVDPNMLLDAISNPETMKLLHTAYNHVHHGHYTSAAATVIFYGGKELRAIALSAIWQGIKNTIKEAIIPNFVRRYFANDKIVQILHDAQSIRDKDGICDIGAEFSTQVTTPTNLAEYSIKFKFFKGYDLSEVNFANCIISDFNLKQAIFNERACFVGAIIKNCDFTGIEFRKGMDFLDAKIDCKSLLTLLKNKKLIGTFEGCTLTSSKITQEEREILNASEIGNKILENTKILALSEGQQESVSQPMSDKIQRKSKPSSWTESVEEDLSKSAEVYIQ